MNTFERAFSKVFHANVPDLSAITPGVVVDVHQRGRRKGLLRFGDTYEFYDLASLTKIIYTTSACVAHFSEYPRELRHPVHDALLWWRSRTTTPWNLLTHTAGLEWWLPMYKRLRGPLIPQRRWDRLKQELAQIKPRRGGHRPGGDRGRGVRTAARTGTRPRTRGGAGAGASQAAVGLRQAVYSDLDLWLMGAFLEARMQKSLLEIWHTVAESWDVEEIFFHPRNTPRYARSRYAPTENCPWRRRVLQGEVHDENTWALGGVAPHAGLFGTVEGVSGWGLELRRRFRGDSGPARRENEAENRMLRRFARRQIPRAQGDWGLGFMKPTKGRASCGRYFHASSFGHTGFVGTSFWYDPVADLLVVVLSNRVHPTRANSSFLQLRPQIHNWVVECLSERG
ncbi:MAG: serine hydrolase domain-containing protein [Bdellovibrionales bacterium]